MPPTELPTPSRNAPFAWPRATATRSVAWVDRRVRALQLALAGAYVLVGALYLRWSGVNSDESFYVSAAHAASQGLRPWSDFFFPQSPLVAYAYAPAGWGAGGYDLVLGRGLALAFGLGALLFAMATAERLAGRRASLVAGLALVASPPLLDHFTDVSPLPLAALLLAASAFVLTTRMPAWARYALAASLIALAAAMRLNLVVALGPLALLALADERRLAPAFAVVLSGGATLALAFGPFLAADPDAGWWALVTYHLLDGADPSFTRLQLLKYKLDGLRYFAVEAAFVLGVLLAGGLYAWGRHRGSLLRKAWDDPFPAYLAATSALLVGVNFVKVYVQPYYLLPALPLLAVLAGVVVARLHARAGGFEARQALVALLAAALLLNVVATAPDTLRRNAANTSPDGLREAGAHLAALLPEEGTVLTFLPSVAAFADRPVHPGSEMGYYSYGPALAPEVARANRLHNAESLRETLASRAPDALALTAHDFAYTPFPTARLPAGEAEENVRELWRLVEEGYEPTRTFGAGEGAVTVYLRRA